MNNTTKAKYDVAERMLKGKIPVEEVSLMTGINIEELKKMEEDLAPQVRDAKILQDLDNVDLNIGEILIDNYGNDEQADEDW